MGGTLGSEKIKAKNLLLINFSARFSIPGVYPSLILNTSLFQKVKLETIAG